MKEKEFDTVAEMQSWLEDAEDRYSPYDIVDTCWDRLKVWYIRVD
jgi:hypothetical protein